MEVTEDQLTAGLRLLTVFALIIIVIYHMIPDNKEKKEIKA